MYSHNYSPLYDNELYINPGPGNDLYYYVNSNFEQTYQNLLIDLDQLRGYSGDPIYVDLVDDSDFNLSSGLKFDGAYTTDGSSYARFIFDGVGHGWQGSLGVNVNPDFLGNGSYDFSTSYFKVDTDHPEVVSLVKLDSASIPSEYYLPSTNSTSHYFLVSFSEMVSGYSSNSNYLVSDGYYVSTVITPTSVTTGFPTDEILLEVSKSATSGSASSAPTLGLSRLLEAIHIESLTGGLPTNVDIYTSSTNSNVSGENWYRMDLSHDVSKYAFLQPDANGTNYQYKSGSFNVDDSTSAPLNYVTEIAFQENVDQVDEFFFRTYYPINPITASVDFYEASTNIEDLAGNYLSVPSLGSNDDLVTIDSATVQSTNGITLIDPPTSGGFDTLRVVLAGDVYVDANDEILENHYIQEVNGADVQGFDVYDFNGSNFSRYEINATTVRFDGFAGDSEVVALYRIGNNDINLVSSATDVETDIIDYSAVSDGIRVDLSEANSTNDWYVDVSVIGGTINQVDTLRGAEGVVGGSGDDHITGNGIDNILVGGGGADRLDGDDGDDILVGGDSPLGLEDVLLGGKGQDILIDLDGASMTGGQDDRLPNSTAPKDIYVVRTGSTIEDYKTAEQNAGLAGRAVGNINDIIVLNVSLLELAFQINNGVTELSSAEMNEIAANIKIHVSNSDSDEYWEVTATSYIYIVSEGESERINLSLGDVEVMAPVNQGQSLTIVPLDDNYFDHLDTGDIFSQNIDNFVLDNTLPDLVASLNDEGSFNLAFALEETRDGVVRSNGQTLMFGDFDKLVRIFNPGKASEMIFGSRGKDTYEFLVQDFRTTNTNTDSAVAQYVGDDTIRDTGGLDNVLFSGLSLETISKLEFEAVSVGREKGNYSLKTNYNQTENGFVNEGSFTWTGHFREGFKMQLEKITLGDDELSLAQNIYNYDDVGRLLSNTPIQQALEGEDTIMVGNSGRANDSNTFKLDKNGTAPIEQTNLYIWGAIDSHNDVIDLSEFISEDDIKAIEDETYYPLGMPQGMIYTKFEVNLDEDVDTFELAIHFMGGFTADSATLEDMIVARAIA